MKIIQHLPFDVLEFRPEIYYDERGYFLESFNEIISEAIGNVKFVQDNESFSYKDVLRGLHYQIKHPQGKLVKVLSGSVFDVAVDLRKSSENFGKWISIYLDDFTKNSVWIPPGYAHGFLVLSDKTTVIYKVTERYYPGDDRCLLWNDLDVTIKWPGGQYLEPKLSYKDKNGTTLKDAEVYT